MNLDKLTAPWTAAQNGVKSSWIVQDAAGKCVVCTGNNQELAERIALWRNAEYVMVRRGWYAELSSMDGEPIGRWYVCSRPVDGSPPNLIYRLGGGIKDYADPFTALVEADAWYKANVEPQETRP